MVNKLNSIMVQDDCFAISDDMKSCKCLSKLYCKKEHCNFYKSKKEINVRNIEDSVRVYDNKYR